MELKALLLGLAFTVGIFAVKSGAGLAYPLARMTTRRHRGAIVVLFMLGYLPLFALAWFLVVRFDFPAHLQTVITLVKHGMIVHFFLALLLLLWGVVLLSRREAATDRSRGWLLLALPCPVCFSVILCSAALLHSLFADDGWILVWLCGGYLVVALGSALLLMRSQGRSERRLGGLMLSAALYFIITVVVVPQFNDLERIYRLSKTMVVVADERLLLMPAWMIPVFIIGYLKIKKS